MPMPAMPVTPDRAFPGHSVRIIDPFGAGPQKGVLRLIDVVRQTPQDASPDDVAAGWDGTLYVNNVFSNISGVIPSSVGANRSKIFCAS